MGICGLGGFWYTSPPEEVHNHEQSSLDTGAGAGSGSCSGPGSGSSVSASSDTRKFAQFDVFLNHRGPDVKRNFVSHLDAALRRVGRNPFLDAKSLVKGHHAFHSINEALTGVLVHVAIFSPGYAESKYCLNELCDMLVSKKPFIPVFYNVEPENLRWPENKKGPFAKAFIYHMEKGRKQDVERWKGALLEVADIMGFRLIDSANEMKLVEKIVAAVLKALPAPCPLAPARHPVGLEKTSKDVINILHNMKDNVGILGICGMGGIGKTTLAMEVYNQEQSRFENCCFLRDVKDAKGIAILDLQMKMVTDLLGEDAKMCRDYARWFEVIQKKKILLILDDISNIKQFDQLILDLKQLAPGSRVLITSREIDMMNKIMMVLPQPQRALYFMPELSSSDSLELFIRCAFQKKNLEEVDASFHENVKKITEACGGVPLALEVIGGFLADKTNQPKCWSEAISELRKEGDIMSRLQISYDGLANDHDKCMFVDIACFMLGHSKKKALEVWNSVGYDSASWSLNRLIDKCLVKVDFMGHLSMHDLLRDMGRKIVMDRRRGKLEMQSHIWDPTLATKILHAKHVSNEVLIALSLVGIESPTMALCKAEAYARMRVLKYLLLDGCPVNGNFSGWSEELRWLQWRYFPHEELPCTLNLQGLAVLDLAESLSLTRVWTKNFEIECPCQELRILILKHCTKLEELPEHIEKLVKLKFLDLEGCSTLSSLPDSLGNLTELEVLNMSRCSSLTSLPYFRYLGSLQKLNLSSCTSLTKLPESFAEMSSLEKLDLSYCTLLQSLPLSVCALKKLKVLRMNGMSLKELPENFGQLCSLEKAFFFSCKSMVELPESFGNLSNLEDLLLTSCELLRKLPYSISRLKKLRFLDVEETALEKLPKDFGQLCSLRSASFNGCKHLVQLPESFGNLSNLEDLWLNGCELVQKLPPSFHMLTKLRVLHIGETALVEIPEDFGQLSSLHAAYFCGCKSLVKLPESFGNLSNLQLLWLNGCGQLEKLPASFSRLTNLKQLHMKETALEELSQDFGQLRSLIKADFEHCKRFVELPESFGELSNLEKLQLKGCTQIQNLPPSFNALMKLKVLTLSETPLVKFRRTFISFKAWWKLILTIASAWCNSRNHLETCPTWRIYT